MNFKLSIGVVFLFQLSLAGGNPKMKFEKSFTDSYTIVSAKSPKVDSGDDGKVIHKNFEILQSEFPKLGVEQSGPVIIIYRYRTGQNGQNPDCYEIETAYPIKPGSKVQLDKKASLNVLDLSKKQCLKYHYTGPVWETPWGAFFKAAKEAGYSQIREGREVYKVFKGGASKENEIEMQIILD
jgi:hypothetical protein